MHRVLAVLLFMASIAAAANTGLVVWGQQKFDTRDFDQPFTAIAAGYQHTVALKADGTVAAWGGNYSRQCLVPVGLSGVAAIAAGYEHTVALKADGTVVAWGRNDDGQCTVPVGLADVASIAAGNRHTVAMKADGTVVAWGSNY
jgi:alpha-tubulin suppressor-like RCC1 family protein